MIPPGGEGEIKVTLKPKGGHSEITKQITVLSNDPEQPKFPLTVKATLLVDMLAEPASVPMYNLSPGEPGTATFSLRRSEGSTATVKSVRIQDTKLFSIREVATAPGALATYEVRFKGREVGTSTTNVIVDTTGEYTPTLTVPVHASASYNLRYPKRIMLAQRGDSPIERTFRISTRRGDPPRIKKIEDPDNLLEIEVQKPDGPSVNIHVRLRDPDKIDDEPHKLVVRTNDRDEPRIEIVYQVQVPRKRKPAPANGKK